MNVLLILNQSAGSLNGDRDAVSPDALLAALEAAGLRAQLRLSPPLQLCETLAAARGEQPDALVVGGGDGTISAAAACLAGSPVALGVLPLGTLNHFAHDLGLPPDWREAITALASGITQAVDVGEVNGRVFINNCSIGSYAEAVRKRDALRRLRGGGKWWAMLRATLRVFRHLRRLRLRVDANGKTSRLRAPFVVVSNNRYRGHVLGYSLRPRLDEGRLCLYTTREHRRLGLLRLTWQSLVRKIDDVDGLETLELTEATLAREGDQRLAVALDGELVDLKGPLHFRTRPGALRVLAPREKQVAR